MRRNLSYTQRIIHERECERSEHVTDERWQNEERLRRHVHVDRMRAGRRAVSAVRSSEAAALLREAVRGTDEPVEPVYRPVRRLSLDQQTEPHPLLWQPSHGSDELDDDDAVYYDADDGSSQAESVETTSSLTRRPSFTTRLLQHVGDIILQEAQRSIGPNPPSGGVAEVREAI